MAELSGCTAEGTWTLAMMMSGGTAQYIEVKLAIIGKDNYACISE